MTNIQSNSQITQNHVSNIFLPEPAILILYLALSILTVALLNLGSLINSLSGSSIGATTSPSRSFSGLFSSLNASFSHALNGRIGQILLWAFVGALVYMLIWLGRSMINSFENDIIADHYLHPSGYDRTNYWTSALAVKVFAAALVLLLIGVVFMSARSVMPALAHMAGGTIHNFKLSSPLYISSSILGITLDIYIISVLVRLIAHLWELL